MSTRSITACPRCGTLLPADVPAGACPRCLMAMQFATETAFTGAGAAPQKEPLSPAELAPHFPSLEILECLGRGGMGVVYKARQKSLNRTVALKLLAPERVSDPEFARRFAREAEALAALNHPGIVTVYDFGETAGAYYLLMEFVDGVNLRHAMRAGRISSEQALAIVPTICEALQYAHEHGIVHRDIKPENLLLDKAGRVKVADFGIARMLGTEPRVTGLAESRAAGTPRYMAPEQLRVPGSVDHRADIYSLGVVLYEMLTGELPAPNLPLHKTAALRFDVRLDEIVLRALQRQPEQRYHSAREFQTALQTVTQTQPQPAMSETPPPPRPASAPTSLRKGLAIAMVTVLVATTLFYAPRPTRPPRYYAQATIETRPDNYSKGPFRQGDATNAVFLNTQAQVLRKRELLDPVIEQLHLATEWARSGAPLTPDAARERLLDALRIHPVENTGLLDVGVFDSDPKRAADIANALVTTYRNLRISTTQRGLQLSMKQFVDEVEKQRRVMEEAYVKAAQLRAKLGIVDPDLEGLRADARPPSPEQTEGSVDRSTYVEAKARYTLAKDILMAAELRLSTARMEYNVDFEPVRVWEKATPPTKPVPWWK